jgi:hypothetical protein
MSRYDATCVQRRVIGRRSNCLRDAVGLAEKLVITYELVEKI